MSTSESDGEKTSPQTNRVLMIVAIVLVGAIALALRPRVSRWLQHPTTPTVARQRGVAHEVAPSPPAGAAELAFMAPLAVGSRVGGAELVRISAVEEGLIHVDLRKSGEVTHLAIGLVHPGYNAPRAGRYAVYIWEETPSAEASPLAEALAASLRARGDREPPPGLTSGTFHAPPH